MRFTAGHALGAQVRAEIKNRARSTGTLVALFVILIGSYWAIPNAEGRAVSLSWTLPDGRMQAPLYTAGYLGIAMSVLSILFFVLASFYLVAGAVRHDRERGIGLILAATPMSRSAYLGAKWIANTLLPRRCCRCSCCRSASTTSCARAWGRSMHCSSSLRSCRCSPPAAFVAATALLFDVTPVLRSRGGLVIGSCSEPCR